MLDRRDDARFAEELLPVVGAGGARRIEHLDGDVTLQHRIVGAEYRAETADAEHTGDVELAAKRIGQAPLEFGNIRGHGGHSFDSCSNMDTPECSMFSGLPNGRASPAWRDTEQEPIRHRGAHLCPEHGHGRATSGAFAS
ncbi:MAG: hypothetical protein KBF47_02485 [Gemmatimonadales bacterium]|nr:hypothetical protein [Gemmatimonadales bacterium]